MSEPGSKETDVGTCQQPVSSTVPTEETEVAIELDQMNARAEQVRRIATRPGQLVHDPFGGHNPKTFVKA